MFVTLCEFKNPPKPTAIELKEHFSCHCFIYLASEQIHKSYTLLYTLLTTCVLSPDWWKPCVQPNGEPWPMLEDTGQLMDINYTQQNRKQESNQPLFTEQLSSSKSHSQLRAQKWDLSFHLSTYCQSVLQQIMKMGRIWITNNIRKSKLDKYE